MLSSVVTDDETVELSFEKDDGTVDTFQVSSISNLLYRVKNLEYNIKEISNLDNLSNANIIFPDGSIRNIIASEQFVEPKSFSVPTLSVSYQKENSLKHLLVEPYTYAKIPVSRILYPSYDKCLINKLIVKTENSEQEQIFDTLIKGKQLAYDDLINQLAVNSLEFVETILDVAITAGKFRKKGVFSVLDIRKKIDVVNGTDASDQSVVYKLNTLFYKDIENNADIYLKNGDSVNVGDSTVYNVNFVDKSTGYVGFTLIKGFEPITLGIDSIKYFGDQEEPTVDTPLYSNELSVVFLKPINSSLLIESNDWGVGFAYNSNELLANKSVANLATALMAVANEQIVPSTEFVKPNQPILQASNFSVVLINKHKATSKTVGEIKDKFSKKTVSESELKLLQDSLQQANSELSVVKADDYKGKKDAKDKIQSVTEDLVNKSKEVEALAAELSAVSAQIGDFKAKYEVHGFILEPTYPTKNGKIQTIIGYDTEYRYLDVNAEVDENKSFDLKDTKISKKAVIPKWLKMTNATIKEKSTDGVWIEDSLADVDKLTSTQVTIPISSGEIVEIRTRAISEIGYPFQTNYSDWSEPLQVTFPQEIDNDTEVIVSMAQLSAIYTKMYERLVELGLTVHNVDSAIVGDKYYAHFLRNLGTEELTPENKPKDAQTVINAQAARLLAIENTIGSLSGTLKIRLLKEDETVLGEISNNSTFKLLDDYYKTIIENETVKKGTVLNRIFYVEVSNIGDGDIEIMPYVTGISSDRLVQAYTGYSFNSNEYENFRQYFDVPITRLGTIEDADFLASKSVASPFVELEKFQSSQVKGQAIYSRYKDITLNENLFAQDLITSVLPIFSAINPQTFIWNGTQTVSPVVSGNGGYTDFCIHIDHPLLQVSSDFMQNYSQYYSTGAEKTLPKQSYDAIRAYYPPFTNTVRAADQTYLQAAYTEYSSAISAADITNFPNKTSFLANDKYLIGSATCGLYLTLGSNDSLFLNENFVNQGLKIVSGGRILIPMVASSRLTDYYGVGNTGVGNIGGVIGATNVAYTKKLGIDLLVKESKLELQKLLSFDLQYTMQYEKSSLI